MLPGAAKAAVSWSTRLPISSTCGSGSAVSPVKVFSKNINGCHRDIGVENDVTMLVEFANGATGTFTTCTHDAIGTDRLEIDLDGGKIVVDNSKTAHVYHYIDKEGNPCTEDT